MKILTGVLWAALICSSLLISCANCLGEETGETVTITGQIISVKMTAMADNPWEELAIKDSQGKVYILIGKAVEKLQEAIGKTAAITGVTKPPMLVSGASTAVLEVKRITFKSAGS